MIHKGWMWIIQPFTIISLIEISFSYALLSLTKFHGPLSFFFCSFADILKINQFKEYISKRKKILQSLMCRNCNSDSTVCFLLLFNKIEKLRRLMSPKPTWISVRSSDVKQVQMKTYSGFVYSTVQTRLQDKGSCQSIVRLLQIKPPMAPMILLRNANTPNTFLILLTQLWQLKFCQWLVTLSMRTIIGKTH